MIEAFSICVKLFPSDSKVSVPAPLVDDFYKVTNASPDTRNALVLRDVPWAAPVVSAAPVIAPYVTQSAAVIEPEESMLLTFRQ